MVVAAPPISVACSILLLLVSLCLALVELVDTGTYTEGAGDQEDALTEIYLYDYYDE